MLVRVRGGLEGWGCLRWGEWVGGGDCSSGHR